MFASQQAVVKNNISIFKRAIETLKLSKKPSEKANKSKLSLSLKKLKLKAIKEKIETNNTPGGCVVVVDLERWKPLKDRSYYKNKVIIQKQQHKK